MAREKDIFLYYIMEICCRTQAINLSVHHVQNVCDTENLFILQTVNF